MIAELLAAQRPRFQRLLAEGLETKQHQHERRRELLEPLRTAVADLFVAELGELRAILDELLESPDFNAACALVVAEEEGLDLHEEFPDCLSERGIAALHHALAMLRSVAEDPLEVSDEDRERIDELVRTGGRLWYVTHPSVPPGAARLQLAFDRGNIALISLLVMGNAPTDTVDELVTIWSEGIEAWLELRSEEWTEKWRKRQLRAEAGYQKKLSVLRMGVE
jgi:hypothetical protein